MKNTILKYAYIIFEIILLTLLTGAVYFNYGTLCEYYCGILHKVYNIKLSYIIITFFTVGVVFGYILNNIVKSKMSQMYSAYQKRHETISIEKDSDKAKIATLEAKIATLEVALESALKKQ